jgi:hypothetical protein
MMMKRVVGMIGFVLLTAAASGQTLPTSDLTRILQDLQNDSYARREAAQQELSKIPSSQISVLRSLAETTKDSEVQWRLESRIAEMETWDLLHPPGFTLNLANATLEEVATAMRPQLGPTVQLVTMNIPFKPVDMRPAARAAAKAARAAASNAPYAAAQSAIAAPLPTPKFTLHTEGAPFWKVIDLLNRQYPINVDSNPNQLKEPCITGICLRPLHQDAKPDVYKVVDTLAYTAEIRGTRGDRLQVRVNIKTDLRVTFAHCTNIATVKKFTNQAGADLQYQRRSYFYVAPFPMWSWNSVLDFNDVSGLRRIGELRGTTTVSLVAHHRETVIDMSGNAPLAPLNTPRGTLTFDNGANPWRIGLTTPPEQIATFAEQPAIIIQGYDAEGVSAGFYPCYTEKPSASYTMSAQATKLHILWADKTIDLEIPIEIKDLEIPDEPQPLEDGAA